MVIMTVFAAIMKQLLMFCTYYNLEYMLTNAR